MPFINISNEAHNAIRSATRPGKVFAQNGRRDSDGSWTVPIDDEVWERLQQLRLAGETDSDVIIRLVHSHGRKKN